MNSSYTCNIAIIYYNILGEHIIKRSQKYSDVSVPSHRSTDPLKQVWTVKVKGEIFSPLRSTYIPNRDVRHQIRYQTTKKKKKKKKRQADTNSRRSRYPGLKLPWVQHIGRKKEKKKPFLEDYPCSACVRDKRLISPASDKAPDSPAACRAPAGRSPALIRWRRHCRAQRLAALSLDLSWHAVNYKRSTLFSALLKGSSSVNKERHWSSCVNTQRHCDYQIHVITVCDKRLILLEMLKPLEIWQGSGKRQYILFFY